jgi:hypothetical protein
MWFTGLITPWRIPGAPRPYIHEEPLEGFPESVVRWAASAGAAVGIAPLALHPGEH